ncbi:CAP domain-containing protein [Amphibacillus sediminis]|uniref:CAP domain-containing protein n=1 Tax=Amphibacillus sediminis TaxID=360185 RepID=UPI00082A42D8|nr:CAP domain-containing protein [Amphibacillus sediminis]
MKKKLLIILLFLLINPIISLAETTYTVKEGDSLWEIAIQHQLAVTEIIEANPQFDNPDLIYPNDKVRIPNSDAIKHTEHIVIQLTNQERARQGLPILRPDLSLSQVAREKSADMLEHNYFSHTSPAYGTPFEMMDDFGVYYLRAAENIARGEQTPHDLIKTWMQSPEHRANILGDFTHIGVGYVEDGKYWTQMLIKR